MNKPTKFCSVHHQEYKTICIIDDADQTSLKLIKAAPGGHAILSLLKRFIDEDANSISFGALMGTDDETPLRQAVKAYFAKVEGRVK